MGKNLPKHFCTIIPTPKVGAKVERVLCSDHKQSEAESPIGILYAFGRAVQEIRVREEATVAFETRDSPSVDVCDNFRFQRAKFPPIEQLKAGVPCLLLTLLKTGQALDFAGT